MISAKVPQRRSAGYEAPRTMLVRIAAACFCGTGRGETWSIDPPGGAPSGYRDDDTRPCEMTSHCIAS